MGGHVVYGVLLGMAMQALLVSAGRPDFVTDDMMAMVMDDKNRCMGAHGTTEALIDEGNAGPLPNNPALTCYLDCLYSAFGIIDEGQLDVDMLVGFLPDSMQAKAQTILSACAGEADKVSDACDKVYQVAKCIQGKDPSLWFVL